MEDWNQPRIGDLLREGPKSWGELETHFPKATLSRHLKPLVDERTVFKLEDGRYALTDYSEVENMVFRRWLGLRIVMAFRREWPRASGLRMRRISEVERVESIIKTALAKLGVDSEKSENREAGFRAYRRMVSEVEKRWLLPSSMLPEKA